MKLRNLIFLLLIATSCKGVEESRTIRISLPTEPPTLDWNLATDSVSYQILNQMMEGLTQYDEDLNPIPAVAQSWEVSADGKTYIFHINPDYQWSDGKAVTANDFYFSWIRLLKPETAAEYAYFLFDIVGAQEFNSGKIKDPKQVGLSVVDPHTFQVTLKHPVVFFPSITTFMVTYPLRQDIIEKQGTAWTNPQHIVTLGPYLLTEWWHEYRLTLTENPLYHGSPKPEIHKIIIHLVSDPSTALNLYELDYLDVASPPNLALPFFIDDPEMIRKPKLRGTYFGFNLDQEPYNNKSLRQSLAHALNKEELPKFLKGGEIPINSWIPPGMFGHEPSIGLEYNVEKGRRAIQNIIPPKLMLSFNTDSTNQKVAEWAQAQWKKNLGLDVELHHQEWKSFLSELKQDPPGFFRLGWGADYPDPDNFMNLFTSYSGNNHSGWKSSHYDALITEGATQNDPKKRKAIYDQAQKLLLEEEVVIIPLFVSAQNILVKRRFRPYPLLAMDVVYYKLVGQIK